MHPMMDPRHAEQHREEMWREVELHHLAKIVRAARKNPANMRRVSAPAWELKRVAGRLLKLWRTLKKAG